MSGRRGVFHQIGRLLGGTVPRRLLGGIGAVALVVAALVLLPSLSLPVVVGLLLLALAVATVTSGVEIVQAYEQKALTVFGEYRGLLDPGLHFVPPFVSRTYAFDKRTKTLDVPEQDAITRDNSPVHADAVVYIRVMDAERAFLEIEDYQDATASLAQTTLRAVLGDMELDDTLSRRDTINRRIGEELDEATDQWGIRVEAVEIRTVLPSAAVRSAMEQQASAERRRRAMILEAQGERQAEIARAQGGRDAAVIRAQGEKQSQILEAQGDAIATVLRARAAESMGERAIVERGLESLERIGQSPSTTFVLPQELTSLLGRSGKHIGAGTPAGSLESLEFDDDTRELLGLDDFEETEIEIGEPRD